MTASLGTVMAGLAGVVALLGAAAVVLARDVMRLILGLGSMLLAVAAMFGIIGASFLAVAEIFVYVGGVLVLFLFAIMLVHRANAERPVLLTRHDPLAAVVAGGIFVVLLVTLSPVATSLDTVVSGGTVTGLAHTLVTSGVAHFEAVGVLLLAALIAVVSILGGGRE